MDLVRKLEFLGHDEWQAAARRLVREGGFKFGAKAEVKGTIIGTAWIPSESFVETRTRQDPWGRRRHDYPEQIRHRLRGAREQLYIDVGARGFLCLAEVTAKSHAKRFRIGQTIVLTGVLGDEPQDSLGAAYEQYNRWAVVIVKKPRVNRKESKRLEAERLVERLISGERKAQNLHGLFSQARRREIDPLYLATLLQDAVGRGKLHLRWKSRDNRLDSRRWIDDTKPSPLLVSGATSKVISDPWWQNPRRHNYYLTPEPPERGEFENPWTAEETTEGKAKRGDWVTASFNRWQFEGPRMLDVSSLGVHVGVGDVSTHNFWCVANQSISELWENRRFKQACLRFDQREKPGMPRVEIDVVANTCKLLEGDKEIYSMPYSMSRVEELEGNACFRWRARQDIDDETIRWMVREAWERADKEAVKRLEEAGVLHLVPRFVAISKK